jgi:hydrogenase expression/formation protein HypC
LEVYRSSQIAVTSGVVLNSENAAVCLAIPGKILEIQEQGTLRAARVQFGGIVRQVSLNFVPEAGLGDYVMVHVGFAISRVDESEAQRTYKLLEEMGALEAELPPPAEA